MGGDPAALVVIGASLIVVAGVLSSVPNSCGIRRSAMSRSSAATILISASGLQLQPAVQLGQDLRPAAARRPDQEDPAELLLVRPVARRQRRPGRRRRRRWRPARPRRTPAPALGPSACSPIRGWSASAWSTSVGAQRGGCGPAASTVVQGRVRAAADHLVHPARHGQAGGQALAQLPVGQVQRRAVIVRPPSLLSSGDRRARVAPRRARSARHPTLLGFLPVAFSVRTITPTEHVAYNADPAERELPADPGLGRGQARVAQRVDRLVRRRRPAGRRRAGALPAAAQDQEVPGLPARGPGDRLDRPTTSATG